MKTAAKVFIILSMIFGFWAILPIIFGAIALSQMKTKKPSTGISVCVLIFCSLLGGIFLLCSKADSYIPPVPPQPAYIPQPQQQAYGYAPAPQQPYQQPYQAAPQPQYQQPYQAAPQQPQYQQPYQAAPQQPQYQQPYQAAPQQPQYQQPYQAAPQQPYQAPAAPQDNNGAN